MLYAIAFVLFLAADQLVKRWTVGFFAAPAAGATFTTQPPRGLLSGVLELTRVHNYGAAWSSFSGLRWVLIVVTVALMGAVAFLLLRRIVRHRLGVWACTLVLAGGVGNLIDRVRLGYVVDMLHFVFWPSYPVFNVADVCIVAGAILGAVYYCFVYEKTDAVKKDGAHG